MVKMYDLKHTKNKLFMKIQREDATPTSKSWKNGYNKMYLKSR